MPDLGQWAELITEQKLDGWLIADFRRSNPILTRLIGLTSGILTRRCFLWIPAHGEPVVLGSRVDGHTFQQLNLPLRLYGGFDDMCSALRAMLPSPGRVAMEYAPFGVLPTVSRVDAGMVDLIRSWGIDVVSSGPLISALEVWDTRRQALHHEAARGVDEVRAEALEHCAAALRRGEPITEGALERFIRGRFAHRGLTSPDGPDVAVDAHSADPHYSVGDGEGAAISPDSVLLIDLWAQVDGAGDAPFADSTWMAYTGATPPTDLVSVFNAVRSARDVALSLVTDRVEAGQRITGREVDIAARKRIAEMGYEPYLVHRTGHSLGTDHVHGMGTNLDGVEFPDDRSLLAGTGFTVEPGLYLPGRFGIRLEVSAILAADGIDVTTERQRTLTLLAAG